MAIINCKKFFMPFKLRKIASFKVHLILNVVINTKFVLFPVELSKEEIKAILLNYIFTNFTFYNSWQYLKKATV